MTVHFIGAGPGAADLLTLRARDRIASCGSCLYAGSLIPEGVLAHLPSGVSAINTAGMALETIIQHMIRATADGHDVARLQSGDLAVYSALSEQLAALTSAGIAYTLTPGVPAFSAAAAALGQELTRPEIAQSLVITRVEGRASAMPPGETLARFAATGSTLALHLSLHRAETITQRLLPHYGVSCPVAVVQRASWPNERIVRATLGTLVDTLDRALTTRRSAILFVGPVLAARSDATLARSALYDPKHVSTHQWAHED
ncbi:precorrin-4 C(11)-methyltransferase [Salinisphaera sp. Q1T1-3]|uniref:precorrin-4 C(11)-methyltransferase n=1 Tax=Salinisphaera sp. Q1T1-3 TaxID=2321229 RepID=UPI000E709B22|nr:precorrin-4 C(11)-methyltransferase [Salinisphaera sp. Q1T1-3]RJS95113.1 precorrin-4 C(11)-methyltransferase [Salinisphaera sp. Q1T1-3]